MSPLERTWQTVHLIDGLQTLAIARDDCYEEQNYLPRKIIGEHPDAGSVVLWWAGMAAIHWGIGEALDRAEMPRLAKGWRLASIGITSSFVISNHQEGLRVIGNNRPIDGC